MAKHRCPALPPELIDFLEFSRPGGAPSPTISERVCPAPAPESVCGRNCEQQVQCQANALAKQA